MYQNIITKLYQRNESTIEEVKKFCIAGSTQSGKSSLFGRLLWECGSLHEKRLQKATIIATSALGDESAKWACLYDYEPVTGYSRHQHRVLTKLNPADTESIVLTCLPAKFPRSVQDSLYSSNIVIFVIDAMQCLEDGRIDQCVIDQMIIAKVNMISQMIVVINKLDVNLFQQDDFNTVVNIVAEEMDKLGIADNVNQVYYNDDGTISNSSNNKNNNSNTNTTPQFYANGLTITYPFQFHPLCLKIPFIPMSVTTGDNITKISNNLQWYENGRTFLQQMKLIQKPKQIALRTAVDQLLLPIRRSYHIMGIGTIICAKYETGPIHQRLPKQQSVIGYSRFHHHVTTITIDKIPSIECFHYEMKDQQTPSIADPRRPNRSIEPGTLIGMNITGPKVRRIQRGMFMIDNQSMTTIPLVSSFTAHITLTNTISPIHTGYAPQLWIHYIDTPCQIESILWKIESNNIDKDNNNNSTTPNTFKVEKLPSSLTIGDTAIVRINVPRLPIIYPTTLCQNFGRFYLMDSQRIIGYGIVLDVNCQFIIATNGDATMPLLTEITTLKVFDESNKTIVLDPLADITSELEKMVSNQ